MSQSEGLRMRKAQHSPKNRLSKQDDRNIDIAMASVIQYLKERFDLENEHPELELIYERRMQLSDMIQYIRRSSVRAEFDDRYLDNAIIPDGGVLYLRNKENGARRPLLFSEMKHQGTNDSRINEGKERQATGNAIERLGKNLIGIRAMMNHEKITPFVCFGWGCDFAEKEHSVLAKVSTLNEFYPLNKIYIFKRDGNADHNFYSPVSMFFREQLWTVPEIAVIMKEIAETSMRYYIF
jgi:type II restriction enzyme